MNNPTNQISSETAATKETLNVLVVGATGGTGRSTVERLLSEGHNVSAFSRSARALLKKEPRLCAIDGDVTDRAALGQAMTGQDVVIVTLGISENPLRVRFLGSASTPDNVRSAGTLNVIAAMQHHGVRRLIVLSSYGVGATRGLLGFVDRLVFRLILKPQIEDTEAQEAVVRHSGVAWTIAQPVHLTDEAVDAEPYLSTDGQAREMKVARRSVARFLSRAARDLDYVGQSVAISG